MCVIWLCGFIVGCLCAIHTGIFATYIFVKIPLVLFVLYFISSFYSTRLAKLLLAISGFCWGAMHNAPGPLSKEEKINLIRSNYIPSKSYLVSDGQQTFYAVGSVFSSKEGLLNSYVDERSLIRKNRGFLKFSSNDKSHSYFFRQVKLFRSTLLRITNSNQKLKGWLLALYLGMKDYLPKEIKFNFERLGIYHLLVLSGIHVSILGWFIAVLLMLPFRLLYIFRFLSPVHNLFVRDFVNIIVGALVVFYGICVAMPQSIQRASLVYVFYRLSPLLLGKLPQLRRLLFILVMQTILFPVGFLETSTILSWLSFIIVLDMFSGDSVFSLKKLIFNQCLLVSTVAAFYGKLSIIGILVNLIVVPVFSVIYCAAFCLLWVDFLPQIIVTFLSDLQHVFLFLISFLAQIPTKYPWLYLDLLQYSFFFRLLFLAFLMFSFLQLMKKIRKSENTDIP